MSTPLLRSAVDLGVAEAHLYDAIIVGAGPAGSAAAYHLAQRGVDVLLVDRAAFPRDKRCGDAVMPPAMAELELMGVADAVRQRFASVARIGLWVGSAPGDSALIEGGQTAYVAPRREFDALLAEHAVRHGTAWLDRVTVREVLSHQSHASFREPHALLRAVQGSRALELRARVVIAADGSSSRLARSLRASLTAHPGDRGERDPLTPAQDDRARFTAMRGYFLGIQGLSDALEFYFRPGAPGTFYSWIFPVGGGLANVGVIASMEQLRTNKTDLERALAAFLQAPELEGRAAQAQLVGQKGAAPIAAGLRGTALCGDRLLCVGDAAALVDPSSAEGISGALWSGRMAAATAAAALQQNDCSSAFLSSYGAAVRARYLAHYATLLAGPESVPHG